MHTPTGFHVDARYNGNRFLKLTEERLNELDVSVGFKHTVLDILDDIKVYMDLPDDTYFYNNYY